MIELPKTDEPTKAEDKWYPYWIKKGYFHSTPDERTPYTVVIPPPNVTGVLHMGHMLNNTIQDVLVRKARMEGKNVCWVPGTDHASIATEAKVVQKLRAEGIKKSDLSRDEFVVHAWEWKEKHGGIILDQLKKLGASCDWDRTSFTMDAEYSESVIDTFLDLYKKGKIYRGVRMVNWDPEAQTALSDEEVIYKEVNSKLFHVRYKVADTEDQWITIATTRPETILGDSAICVNPNDARYYLLHGKHVIVPLTNRRIPIIADEYVEMDFGTGCLKVTPAHDINDYELGKKYNLETIDIFNSNGTLNHQGLHYDGKDRFEVRKLISKELDEKGYLVKVEDHINKVGYSERTDAVIEPKLSLQWFVAMKELSEPALENVMNGTIKFHPDKFKNTYKHWLENVKDWCISRQLWWGHRIPAWYFGSGTNDYVVAKSLEEAHRLAEEKTGKSISKEAIKQDEDVLDTWFSSWLWPISVFNGITQPNNEEIKYYYPTNDLVTAPEIMFFWVARMIIAGYEYMGDLPFKNVYYTGIVRDKLGRKMSKSLGNSPDPIELIHKYGADGVRVGILISSPAGNDLPFDTSQCEQGRNFANKIWNAFRLVSAWEVKDIEQPKAGYEQPIDAITKEATIIFFERILKIIQPFTPFIAEEIWHLIRERNENEDLVVAEWPTAGAIDENILNQFNIAEETIIHIRNIRKQNNIATKVKMDLFVKKDSKYSSDFESVIIKMGNLSKLESTEDKITNAYSFLVQSSDFFIPFGDSIDFEAERKKIEEELEYTKGFLSIVSNKLNNEKFVSGAPEAVVANEKKKQADAEQKIAQLEEKLSSLV